jgi:hypothetical protein
MNPATATMAWRLSATFAVTAILQAAGGSALAQSAPAATAAQQQPFVCRSQESGLGQSLAWASPLWTTRTA